MKINFLIADEIRPEINGKHTVLGLYPDSTVVLGKPQTQVDGTTKLPEIIDRIAILINISDASEIEHEIKGQFVDPSGNPTTEKIDLGKITIEKGKSITFVIQAKPFKLNGKGIYRFNLFVDGGAYSFPFSIIGPH